MIEPHPPTSTLPLAPPVVLADGSSYVEWGAVFAGAVCALALSFLLLTFGSAVGLSVVSPWSHAGATSTTFGIMTGIWFIVVEIASFTAGGYLAGRMRSKRGDAVEDEVDFRDGMHGFLVWASAVVLGAVLAASTAASVAKSGAEVGATVAASAVSAAGAAATQAASATPTDYYVDMLFRSDNAPSDQKAARLTEVSRILAAGVAHGEVPADDRAYIAEVIAAQTGLNPQEANKRVNDVLTQAQKAATSVEVKARKVADQARKIAAVAGFLTAATLLVSALVAWWAAGLGGQHREANTFPSVLLQPKVRF